MHHENTHTEPQRTQKPRKRVRVIKHKKRDHTVERADHAQPVEGAREPDEILAPDDGELDHELDSAPMHNDIDDKVR